MFAQQAFDRVAILRADLAQDDVLARHQDRIAAEPLDDLAQCRAKLRSPIVDDPTARHRNAEIEPPVALLVPAEMVGNHKGRHFAARPERFAEIFREALARPFFAVLGDDVFEAGMTTVAAIAMIAVQPHHRCGRFEKILRLDEGDRGGEPRIGLRIVVGHPVTAAEQEIVAGEVVPIEQRHDREVVGQDIDRVVLGDRETDLEFARQIALAVERVGVLRRASPSCQGAPSTQIS